DSGKISGAELDEDHSMETRNVRAANRSTDVLDQRRLQKDLGEVVDPVNVVASDLDVRTISSSAEHTSKEVPVGIEPYEIAHAIKPAVGDQDADDVSRPLQHDLTSTTNTQRVREAVRGTAQFDYRRRRCINCQSGSIRMCPLERQRAGI